VEPVVAWVDEGAIHEDLRSEWSALVDRCADASIFQTPEWTLPWWRSFGQGGGRALTVRRAGRLVAFVPMVSVRRRLSGVSARVLAFAGEPLADRLGLLVEDDDPDAADTASRALVAEVRAVDLLQLGELEVDGPGERALERAVRASGLTFSRRVCARAPVLRLEGSWEDVSRGFPRSLRTRLQRARRKQEKGGSFTFARWQPTVDELPELLRRFRDLETRSWKGDRGVGVFGSPERWEFMKGTARECARRGWLDVATLDDGGKLVAYRFGFRFRGAFLDFNLAHDPDAAGFSPGRILLDDIVRDSHRIGLRTVDASRGRISPPHLLADWTSASRWHRRWLVFGRTARGRLLATVERHLKPAARRLRARGGSELPEELR